MSVVMRMEMPQGCEDCPFMDILLCCCAKGRKYAGSSPVRPDWCPIICALPKGHGRLVDADAYSAEMRGRQDAAWKWAEQAKVEEDEVDTQFCG